MRLLVCWLTLAGCITVKDADTDTPHTDEPTDGITAHAAGCEAGRWTLTATAAGLQGDAILHVKDTGPSDPTPAWSETHDEPTRTEDEDQTRYGWALNVAEFQVDYVENVTTLARCEDLMTWAIQVFEPEGAVLDCVSWGQKPEWFDDTLEGGCRDVNEEA